MQLFPVSSVCFLQMHPCLSTVGYLHDPGQNWGGSPWQKSLFKGAQNPSTKLLHLASEHSWRASMYALNECIFTISYVHKLKLVSCVMQMFYILAKFYLLNLSMIEKVCWNFFLACVFMTLPARLTTVILYILSLSLFTCLIFSLLFISHSWGFVLNLNCGFSKKFVTEGFSRYLVYHNYDLLARFFCSSTTDKAFSGYFFQFE